MSKDSLPLYFPAPLMACLARELVLLLGGELYIPMLFYSGVAMTLASMHEIRTQMSLLSCGF